MHRFKGGLSKRPTTFAPITLELKGFLLTLTDWISERRGTDHSATRVSYVDRSHPLSARKLRMERTNLRVRPTSVFLLPHIGRFCTELG